MSSTPPSNRVVINWGQVGRRIRELRGFDQKQSELAAAVGVGQSYISAIEKGKSEVGAELLLNIARHYGKTVEWLLMGSGE